ncbi:MAG: lysine transporter LysE, partial [Bdellovibrio sp. CG_4_9_14_3_um_filter_39_7]
MCIPVGPINVMVINTQIKSSSQNALAIALGGSLMDVVYFMIILSGLSMFDFSE